MKSGLKEVLEPIIRKAAVDIHRATIKHCDPEDKTHDRQCEEALKNTVRESDVEIVYVALALAFQGIDEVGQWPSTYSLGDIVQEDDITTGEAKAVFKTLINYEG